MFENLCLLFQGPSSDREVDGDDLAVPGIRAGRRYSVRTASGTDGPAGSTRLAMYEIDTSLDPARSPLREHVETLVNRGDRPGVSYFGTGHGGHGEIELPDHLYMNFSAQPAFMTLEEYGDWYEEHQAENIAHTSTLTRGWRFALTPFDSRTPVGPTHLAAYQLVDDLAAMQADLRAAMDAGVISLPEWFHRFASVEAVALDDRTVSPH